MWTPEIYENASSRWLVRESFLLEAGGVGATLTLVSVGVAPNLGQLDVGVHLDDLGLVDLAEVVSDLGLGQVHRHAKGDAVGLEIKQRHDHRKDGCRHWPK